MRFLICKAGHRIPLEGITSYSAIQTVFGGAIRNYTFCYDCLGEWASMQFPMREEETSDETSE